MKTVAVLGARDVHAQRNVDEVEVTRNLPEDGIGTVGIIFGAGPDDGTRGREDELLPGVEPDRAAGLVGHQPGAVARLAPIPEQGRALAFDAAVSSFSGPVNAARSARVCPSVSIVVSAYGDAHRV